MTDTTTPLPRWLTVQDIAEDLEVAPQSVRRFIRDGHLIAYRAGTRAWRIRPADYAAWLEARRNVDADGNVRESQLSDDPQVAAA